MFSSSKPFIFVIRRALLQLIRYKGVEVDFDVSDLKAFIKSFAMNSVHYLQSFFYFRVRVQEQLKNLVQVISDGICRSLITFLIIAIHSNMFTTFCNSLGLMAFCTV